MLLRLSKNLKGTDWVVGDIHGCFSDLIRKVEALGLDFSKDRLISVGDLCDRGPDSLSVIRYFQKPGRFAVLGNHDRSALEYNANTLKSVVRYLEDGGAWFAGSSNAVQAEVVDAIEMLPVAIEVPTEQGLVGITHANCPDSDWSSFASRLSTLAGPYDEKVLPLICDRRRAYKTHQFGPVHGVQAVIVGHTSLVEPEWIDNVLHLDTGMGKNKNGRLSFCRLNDFKVL